VRVADVTKRDEASRKTRTGRSSTIHPAHCVILLRWPVRGHVLFVPIVGQFRFSFIRTLEPAARLSRDFRLSTLVFVLFDIRYEVYAVKTAL